MNQPRCNCGRATAKTDNEKTSGRKQEKPHDHQRRLFAQTGAFAHPDEPSNSWYQRTLNRQNRFGKFAIEKASAAAREHSAPVRPER